MCKTSQLRTVNVNKAHKMKLCVFFIFLSISCTYAKRNANFCSSARPPDPQSGCCGIDATSSNYIIGGHPTLLKQYPWLALLEYYVHNSVQTGCGGSLISSRYVLTAAHCMEQQAPQSVRLGEYDTRNNINRPDCVLVNRRRDCIPKAISIPIQNIILHSGYVKSNYFVNDIALLRLTRMVQYTVHIRPICLPTSDLTRQYPRNYNLYAAGWGVIYQQRIGPGRFINYTDTKKRHAALPYVPNQICRRAMFVWDSQICAGGQGASACNGDSGGPLMSKNYGVYEIVGIVSNGPGPCNQIGIPSVFTKVISYRNWVYNNIVV